MGPPHGKRFTLWQASEFCNACGGHDAWILYCCSCMYCAAPRCVPLSYLIIICFFSFGSIVVNVVLLNYDPIYEGVHGRDGLEPVDFEPRAGYHLFWFAAVVHVWHGYSAVFLLFPARMALVSSSSLWMSQSTPQHVMLVGAPQETTAGGSAPGGSVQMVVAQSSMGSVGMQPVYLLAQHDHQSSTGPAIAQGQPASEKGG